MNARSKDSLASSDQFLTKSEFVSLYLRMKKIHEKPGRDSGADRVVSHSTGNIRAGKNWGGGKTGRKLLLSLNPRR
jgi:hypothetical protein